MTELAHAFRIPFGRERRYRLEHNAICWTDGSSEGRVAYADINRAWLWRHPLTGHRCELRHGGRKILLPSYHFPRFIKREDRSASYTPFVRELISRIAGANPRAEFRAGQPWWVREGLSPWSKLIILAAIVLPVVLVTSIVDRWPVAQTYLLVALNVAGALALWRHFRRNASRRFDPHVTRLGELPE